MNADLHDTVLQITVKISFSIHYKNDKVSRFCISMNFRASHSFSIAARLCRECNRQTTFLRRLRGNYNVGMQLVQQK